MSPAASIDPVVIARDEGPRIQRMLRSVASFVDVMLVLDTGLPDNALALVAPCGAVVHPLPWPDDFFEARNVALDLTSADWQLVLEAADWLIDGGPDLLALRHQCQDFAGAVSFHEQLANSGAVTSWMSRVFPGHLRQADSLYRVNLANAE